MSKHNWIPSTLGHGETMCSRCKITNREAAALGESLICKKAIDIRLIPPYIKLVVNNDA